ncbi:hypothetical protein G7B40_026880 [Aetokthonos hydrillicola Thurmond2011]|jgi:hypothetical protein|uniref:Uncharacterized protein n=1 Tax=Aetokthonos hydrillicola Thurmond2011 TaxID=2712845 RepID=A0AAP5MAI3_9CYAN|nr:hypothetical protein [Aetokthonos hydrillicola]MBO3461607.1 hypothetical protein [Aetokthonos hydrillicola CCALA 1050]MBW4589306.1 hypothetical protein [Aetokthonos hydrillicola CCALA 1050]MDR9898160.1 hypothetical protein [Aetokthonos hydrillicola Thurmond2011]
MNYNLRELEITPEELQQLAKVNIQLLQLIKNSYLKTVKYLTLWISLYCFLILFVVVTIGCEYNRGICVQHGTLITISTIPISLIISFVIASFIYKRERQKYRILLSLIQKVDNYNRVLIKMDKLYQLESGKLSTRLMDKDRVIKAFQETKKTLVNALHNERIARKEHDGNTRKKMMSDSTFLSQLNVKEQVSDCNFVLDELTQILLDVQEEMKML